MNSQVHQYLTKYREIISNAAKLLQLRIGKGKPTTISDLADEVERLTNGRTRHWQAKAIISHAARYGAFGSVRAVPGRGLIEVGKHKHLRKVA